MANKIMFGADLIKVLEKEYKLNKLGEVPTKYKNGVTTIDFIYGKEKDIDDLKYNKPYVEFSIDDETDGFISGTMYPNGGVEGIQFDSWDDLKYFMKNAKWTESSLKENSILYVIKSKDGFQYIGKKIFDVCENIKDARKFKSEFEAEQFLNKHGKSLDFRYWKVIGVDSSVFKESRKSMKENRFDDIIRDVENLLLDDRVLKSIEGYEKEYTELAYMLAERLDPDDYAMGTEDDLAREIEDMLVRGKIKIEESKKSDKKSLEESYKSEIDVMYDYEKIFKKKGWTVKRIPDKERTLSAMNILISKNVGDGQLCFYIYCNWGIDYYGDYYSCQINDSSDVEYDYGAVNYRGFDVSGRGFLLFERNITKFCDYLEETLKELSNLKVEVTESKKSVRKSLKEGIDVKIVYWDDTPTDYLDDVTRNDIIDLENDANVYKIIDVTNGKKKTIYLAESKKSVRKSLKESKVDFQSVIDKVIPKEYAKNKNAYKYALSCVESLYNEDEYDSDSAKVYFLNCYISDSFPSWVDELGEKEMDALANALYDGLMKWSDIDSSWLESKKSARKSIKESKASLHEDNVEYGAERIRNKVKGAKVIYNFDDEDCFIDVTEKNGNLWSFTIDFGSGYVYMLEPKEDRGSFGTDNEAFDIIISMLQGTKFND